MNLSDLLSDKLKDQLKETIGNQPMDIGQSSEDDENDIRSELERQALSRKDEVNADFLFRDGDREDDLVEVTVVDGYPAPVSITFEQLAISEENYEKLLSNLEIIALDKNRKKVEAACEQVEQFGEDAVEVIFREADLFDLGQPELKATVTRLVGRLTRRSLKGRETLLGILKGSNVEQYLKIAIMAAGEIRMLESIPDILKHARSRETMEPAFEALMNMRSSRSVMPMVEIITNLDATDTQLLDFMRRVSRRFDVFTADNVQPIFEIYMNCEMAHVRALLGNIVNAFGNDAVPYLLEVLHKTEVPDKQVKACITLGRMQTPYTTNALLEALDKFPTKQYAIVKGLSYTRDKRVADVLCKVLQTNEEMKVIRECIRAIGFSGNANHIAVLSEFSNDRDFRIYLDATAAMTGLGDSKAFEKFVEILTTGSPEEQTAIQTSLISSLNTRQLVQLASRILSLPDNQAISIVTALRKPDRLPNEIGSIIQEKLRQNSSTPLRLEIYRLIGKHANQGSELLPQSVLYDAFDQETIPRVKQEIASILDKMRSVIVSPGQRRRS